MVQIKKIFLQKLKLPSKHYFFIFGMFLPATSLGEVLFEGYSRIYIGNAPAGYTVSRFEADSAKKQFLSTYYLKVKRGAEVSESLRAVADLDLNPISYTYMQIAQGKIKTIDAKFKKQKMELQITENGKTQKIQKNITKNAFLSTFLIYKILKSKEGLQAESRYLYESIFEEEGKVYGGQVVVLKPQIINGVEAFKIRNLVDMNHEITSEKSQLNPNQGPQAGSTEFVSFVNSQGHLLQIEVSTADMRVDLVASQKEATEGFNFDEATMKLLFGEIPLGQMNVLAQARILKEPTKVPGKTEGVPPGRGLLIKQNKAPVEEKKAE